MQITDLTINPRLIIEQIRSQGLELLRAGQVIQATVIEPTKQGIAKLSIGGTEVQARTQVSLVAGERLILDVVKAGKLPELRLIREPTIKQLQAQAMRELLPRQAPLHQLIDNIRSLAAGSAKPATPPAPASPPGATGTAGQPGNRSTTAPQQASLEETAAQIRQMLNKTTGTNTPSVPDRSMTPGESKPSPGTPSLPATNQKSPPIPQPLRDALGPEVAEKVHKILSHTVGEKQPLTPERIRQAFESSGLFLEPKLAAGTAPAVDLKDSLLRLLFQLHPNLAGKTPGKGRQRGGNPDNINSRALPAAAARLFADLQLQTEGALARIQMHQLASLPQEEGTRQVWQFELPVAMPKSTDSFMLQIEKEQRANGQEQETVWSVTLHFNIDPLGQVSARLVLGDEQISSFFTAELANTARELENALPKLSDAFLRAGLKVGKLGARQGIKTEQTGELHPPRPNFPLLDEKA